MNRKAAIELSMNFLVVIILGIVILSMGIYLGVTTFENIMLKQYQLDQQTKDEIWNLLDSGDPVVAPLNSAQVLRGKSIVFGIGIRNTEDVDLNFAVIVETVDTGDCNSNALSILVPYNSVRQSYVTKPILIQSLSKAIVSVPVVVPKNTKPCEYVIDARVYKCPTLTPKCTDPSQDPSQNYGTALKLYVTVTS